ncbi:MAG: histidinol-phosphatase HisJ family protein [Clostridia bacterium]|nr:histidinol-phosphatase HisJ family protein [Clostridia bacterium]
MSSQRLIDMHVHSDNSPDGIHSPMYICECAVKNNLGAIAITDHCEVDKFFTEKYNNMIFHSFFECSKARSAFEGELLVLLGLEIGQPLGNKALADRIVRHHNYDFILGSIHTPHGFNCDIKEIEYDKIDVYKFMEDYFLQLTETAKWDGCDALAHITCPMRRIQGKYQIDFDYSKIKAVTDELLRTMISYDKALEINTSGLRQKIGLTMPDINIIKRYRELGGKLLTIGSDAHNANDCGKGIIKGMEIARECGFENITFYVSRETLEIKL